jgi:hypothetical protein
MEDGPVRYLVRHAHAGSKAKWDGPDLARPLSAQGRTEALGLIEQLLAGRLGRPVEPSEALGVDGTGPGVLELLTDPALDQAVLCTHGEVIGKVFEELQEAGIELSDPPRWPKGSTWILQLDVGHAWKGTYLEPLALEPAGQDPLPR